MAEGLAPGPDQWPRTWDLGNLPIQLDMFMAGLLSIPKEDGLVIRRFKTTNGELLIERPWDSSFGHGQGVVSLNASHATHAVDGETTRQYHDQAILFEYFP